MSKTVINSLEQLKEWNRKYKFAKKIINLMLLNGSIIGSFLMFLITKIILSWLLMPLSKWLNLFAGKLDCPQGDTS